MYRSIGVFALQGLFHFHKLFIQLQHLINFYGYAYLSYCVQFYALGEMSFLLAFGGRFYQLFFLLGLLGCYCRYLFLLKEIVLLEACWSVHVFLSVSCFGLMRRKNGRLSIGKIYI